MKQTFLIDTLEKIRSYLHSRADADQFLVPNQELRLQIALEEIIAELNAAQISPVHGLVN